MFLTSLRQRFLDDVAGSPFASLRNLLALALLGPLVLNAAAVRAQVSAGGLATRVNGSLFGSCRAGSCAVNGGTRAGENLFLRFSQFDTRSGIGRVRIDASGRRNVILGVTHPDGTFLNGRVELRDPATLFLLSPGGLWLGRGAAFQQVPNLLLSTAVGLDLPGGRFDAIRSTAGDLARLGAAPGLRFDAVAVPGGQSGLIGASGAGSLEIENGLLSIDRGLILDAGSGSLRLRQAELRSGESLRLSGHQLDLRDSTLDAGAAGRRSLVELRTAQDPATASYGSVLLDRVQLSGNQISVSGGALRLQDSRITAPKGWVELQTTNPAGLPADLTLVRSSIDLNPKGAADLLSPQLIRRQLADRSVQEILNPTPHIGLFSRGDLHIEASALDASLELPAAPEPGPEAILAALPSRAGVIFAEAAGHVAVAGSTLRADASHTLAGMVLLQAGREVAGQQNPGSLLLRDSQLSTSGGAGAGTIVLQASDGLQVLDSSVRAITDRFPLVPGFTPLEGLPLAYKGGFITLYNAAASQPLLVSGSRIEALHHTAGGPLASPFLGPLDADYGRWGSFGAEADLWTHGIHYGYSGGFLQLYSTAGIRVDQGSRLDVSSLDPASGLIENKAGTMALIGVGPQPIEISAAAVEARSGPPRDPADRDHSGGLIYIYGDGPVRLEEVRIDLRSTTLVERSQESWSLPDPFLSIRAGERLTIAGTSQLLATAANVTEPPLPPSPEAFFSYGINLFGGTGQEVGTAVQVEGPRFEEFDPRLTIDLLREFVAVLERNRVDQERLYTASTTGLPAWQLPLAEAGGPRLQPVELAAMPAMVSQPVEMQIEADAGQQLLEAQQQALADTVASLGLPAGSGRVRSVVELQQRLSRVAGLRTAGSAALPSATYRPAILQLQRADLPGSQVQLTAILLSASGEPVSRSQVLPAQQLQGAIRDLQRQLSRQEAIDPAAAEAPGRRLAAWLLEPLAQEIRSSGATALLLAVDRGLQAIPYAALPFEGQPLGERYALSVSPSLGLLDLESSPAAGEGMLLLAGASTFGPSLAPLPMVPRELGALAGEQSATLLLEEAFTAEAVRRHAAEERHRRLHIATHAEFQPGQSDLGRLFTRQGSLSLGELGGSLRARPQTSPLDLISLSACHTALGDERSELGFVGMALQAGARSGIGTLWKVDDTATAAFFVQYYRYLRGGLGKDQALQATIAAFRSGAVRLEGNALVGPRAAAEGAAPLLAVASPAERQRLAAGLSHPYYWAGMVLTGTPW